MLQSDLNRRIAHATGESVKTIARLGFILSEPNDPIEDPHAESLGPWVLDWEDSCNPEVHSDAQTPIDTLFV